MSFDSPAPKRQHVRDLGDASTWSAELKEAVDRAVWWECYRLRNRKPKQLGITLDVADMLAYETARKAAWDHNNRGASELHVANHGATGLIELPGRI